MSDLALSTGRSEKPERGNTPKEVSKVKSGVRHWAGEQSGRTVIIVVVILVVVVGAAAGWWFLLRSTPEQTVKAYVAAMEEGDEEGILALMTDETAKLMTQLKQQAEAQFGPMPEATPGMGPQMGEGIESIGKANIKGNAATVAIKTKPMKIGDMEMPGFEQEIKLAKEGGKWKIDMAEELKMGAMFVEMMTGGELESAFKEMAEGLAEGLESAFEEMAEGGEPAGPKYQDRYKQGELTAEELRQEHELQQVERELGYPVGPE